MDLLTNPDRANIRLALKDVTDTFYKSAIKILIYGGSLDLHNEDRSDQTFDEVDVLGIVEYKGADLTQDQTGWYEGAEVMVSLFMDDIATLLNAQNKYKGHAEDDYMEMHEKRYKIMQVTYDGPLEDKNVLMIIFGKLDVKVG